MNINIENVVHAMIQKGDVSQEEVDKKVEEYRKISPAQNINDVGEAVVMTFESDNQLGEMVASLMMQVNDLGMLVTQLQTEVNNLKNQ